MKQKFILAMVFGLCCATAWNYQMAFGDDSSVSRSYIGGGSGGGYGGGGHK